MKKISFLLAITFIAAAAVSTLAQNGGKADPGRVKFAKGKASTILTGKLSGDEEQEFVFGAKKGQKVSITNSDSDKFSYRVFNDDLTYESVELAEPTLQFTVPETGDIMIFVRRSNMSPQTAKFSITLAIK